MKKLFPLTLCGFILGLTLLVSAKDLLETHQYNYNTTTGAWVPSTSSGAAVSLTGGNVNVMGTVVVQVAGSPTATPNATQVQNQIATLVPVQTTIAGNGGTANGHLSAIRTQVADVLNARVAPTVTPQVQAYLMNEATPDYTKQANASLQLTQIAQSNLALTPWATQIVGVPALVQATPTVFVRAALVTDGVGLATSAKQDTVATPVFNASNRATTMDTNIQAMATAVAAFNAKAVTMNTAAVAGTVNIGNSVTVASLPNVPQAQAAFTMMPTPVGQSTPVPPASSGSGQPYNYPWGPRDTIGQNSIAVSLTTPVTIGTAAANMFFDLQPSVVHNTSSTSVAFTIKKGTKTLWSDSIAGGDYAYIPTLTGGGTAAQPYIFTLGAAVTSVYWNGQYVQNYR